MLRPQDPNRHGGISEVESEGILPHSPGATPHLRIGKGEQNMGQNGERDQKSRAADRPGQKPKKRARENVIAIHFVEQGQRSSHTRDVN